jgi:hypothetical protein
MLTLDVVRKLRGPQENDCRDTNNRCREQREGEELKQRAENFE